MARWAKKVWTEAEDAMILQKRGECASWDAITAALGSVTRWTVIQRGDAIGAVLPEPEEVEAEDPDRPPYPAGHPVTWGPITKGTCLEGNPYPGSPPVAAETQAIIDYMALLDAVRACKGKVRRAHVQNDHGPHPAG